MRFYEVYKSELNLIHDYKAILRKDIKCFLKKIKSYFGKSYCGFPYYLYTTVHLFRLNKVSVDLFLKFLLESGYKRISINYFSPEGVLIQRFLNRVKSLREKERGLEKFSVDEIRRRYLFFRESLGSERALKLILKQFSSERLAFFYKKYPKTLEFLREVYER